MSGLDQMEPAIRCSVVVLNFELRDVLLDCLASLARAVGPNDEIILVDNASTDDSVAAVRAAFPTSGSSRTPPTGTSSVSTMGWPWPGGVTSPSATTT